MNWHDYRGLLFDMDGTLLDSMGGWRTIRQRICRKVGMPEQLGIDAGSRSALREELAKRGMTWTDEAFAELFYGIMEEEIYQYGNLKPGIRPFLEAARERGIPMGVVTGTRTSTAWKALRMAGIGDFFSFLLAVPEFGMDKRTPDIYEAGAAKLGLDPGELLVFEDALYCVRTLHIAGFAVVGVEDGMTTPAEWAEIQTLAGRTIRDYRELLADGCCPPGGRKTARAL